MLNFFKNLFKKRSNVIDANMIINAYTMAVTPSGKLIIENDRFEATVIAFGECNDQQKKQLGFSIDKTVLDVVVYKGRKKQKTK